MTKHTLRLLLCLIASLITLTSCDELVAKLMNTDDDLLNSLTPKKKEGAQVHKVVFSPDYKTFVVTTRMTQDIGP